jgi:dienelactone hydrolase
MQARYFLCRKHGKRSGTHLISVYFFVLILLILALTACAEKSVIEKNSADPGTVFFKGTHPNDRSFAGSLSLKGRLTKPEGSGPFPAVVLLHGCGGLSPRRDNRWVERLTRWGYLTLQVDSFGPRGISSVCTYNSKDSIDIVQRRIQDAYDAQAYLAGLTFVDANRIAVMGWSHGGLITLESILDKKNAFRAAVAFYPRCSGKLTGLKTPLLILIGRDDDWTPAKACLEMMPPGKSSPQSILKIYPGAYHGFDIFGADMNVMGASGSHHLQYNREAETDAINQVENFLKMYMP